MLTKKETIRRGMARAFFACAWADQAEEQGETLRGEIMDQIPCVFDQAAYHAADTLIMGMEKANGCDIEALQFDHHGDLHWLTWGHYAAMQAMGHGVGLWEYGIELKVPYVEFGSHSLSKDYF